MAVDQLDERVSIGARLAGFAPGGEAGAIAAPERRAAEDG